jgi:hypothetical protein
MDLAVRYFCIRGTEPLLQNPNKQSAFRQLVLY